MIEETIIKYLLGKTVAGNDVYAERPENKPGRYILIEKTGGGKTNFINNAAVAIQSIADRDGGFSLLDALKLNEEVKEAMENITELNEIGGCRLDTDYNFTDSETKEYRYQAVFNISHY